MTTRRQLKELFKNIAESHKQINSFGWGDVPEILSRQDHIYPLMMVTPSDVINEQGQIKHTYIISVADRLKKDISNQVDVDNDTQQIMADLIAIFYNIDYQNLSVELPLNITPFKNIDPQDVIGWYGTFSLIVDENYDYCAVPSEPIPFDPDPPFDCAPAFYRVQYVGGELIQEGTVVSGGSVTVNVPLCPESGSVEWELRDEDNNLLDSGTQPAGIPLTITAPDGLVTITDSDDGVLYVVNINSGGAETQIINDSTVNINKSDSVLIAATTVKAEGVENYNVADSVITLNNTVPTLISTTNVKATDPATIVAPDAEISLNGVKMEDIPSNTSLNISVRRQTGSFQVGSKQGVHWRIANGTLNVNKSDGTLISARTLQAEETAGYNVADSVAVLKDTLGNTLSSTNIKATESEDIQAPDATVENDATTPTYTDTVASGDTLVLPAQTINVNTVNEGSINSVGAIDVSVKDQSNNDITPDSVAVTGRNINLVINVGGGVTPRSLIDDYFAELTNPPSSGNIDDIIDELEIFIANGIFDDGAQIALYIGGNDTDHALYCTQPIGGLKHRFLGGATHNANGVSLNGSTQWVGTRILNSALPLNDKQISIYKRNQKISNGSTPETIIGTNTTNPDTGLRMHQTNNGYLWLIDGGLTNSPPLTLGQTDKLLSIKRTASDAQVLLQDDTILNTSINATTFEVGREIFIGARDNNGTPQNPSNVEFCYSRIGKALTGAQDTIHSIGAQNIQTILSRNV